MTVFTQASLLQSDILSTTSPSRARLQTMGEEIVETPIVFLSSSPVGSRQSGAARTPKSSPFTYQITGPSDQM
jgi:hypothetical protein